jgi:hypothetical protein
MQTVGIGWPAKQALLLSKRLNYLLIAWQRTSINYAKTVSCFSLGQQIIADALLAHDAGGLLGDFLALVRIPVIALSTHRATPFRIFAQRL